MYILINDEMNIKIIMSLFLEYFFLNISEYKILINQKKNKTQTTGVNKL